VPSASTLATIQKAPSGAIESTALLRTLIVGGREIVIGALGQPMDQAFDRLHAAYFGNAPLPWEEFVTAALQYFDTNAGAPTPQDAYFNAFTVIWQSVLEDWIMRSMSGNGPSNLLDIEDGQVQFRYKEAVHVRILFTANSCPHNKQLYRQQHSLQLFENGPDLGVRAPETARIRQRMSGIEHSSSLVSSFGFARDLAIGEVVHYFVI
jgi:hypothetical protein